MIVDQEYRSPRIFAILENFSGSQLARKSITLLFVSDKAIPFPSLRKRGIVAKLRRNIKTAKQFEVFFADNSVYWGILIVTSPCIPCQTATQKENRKEAQKSMTQQGHIFFSTRRQLLRAADKNFFSGSEIYFKGLEINFRATEIYFQAFEKVL